MLNITTLVLNNTIVLDAICVKYSPVCRKLKLFCYKSTVKHPRETHTNVMLTALTYSMRL